ncbi:phosphatidylinositol transfer protein SEC14, putative [Ixodes scapularis]|uniref:Phosphatidylinositol transfer protein SEC14, putative n=1 Tax=Ixodes scapularis TaxID=6945 RepID=B7QFW5_IXOSC|nr:phosphatidylinositol transfer protein SEC14, putative [Ixodes scapularis]|eukprot:XP_002401027.1 phosphatidylinositol transfer protein SEC14, putative [Ixodes scapularis]
MRTSDGDLPAELQRIAYEELGETDQGRADALARLNQLLDEDPELNARRDNVFLLRYIRVRKYNIEAALATLKRYYKNRAAYPSIYDNFLPSNVKPASRCLYTVLPNPDVHGRRVLLVRSGAWIPSLSTHSEAQQALHLVLEFLAADPSSQTVGISVLVDYEGFSMSKLLSANIGLLKQCTEFVFKCVPFRLKAIHVVRQSLVYDILMSIVRHLVNRKYVERIHLHGMNFEGLHKELPAETLPEEYGGSGPALDFDAFWSLIDEQEPSFVESNGYGYLKTKVKGTRPAE